MADYNSSLPVRTENAGDVIAKIADKTVPSQQLAVNADGSINITDNSGSITVDGSVTVSATDLDIRDLSHTQDSVKVGDGTDFLAVNGDGSVNITDNGGSLTVDATNLDIRDLVFASDKVDVSGSSVTVTATDLDIRDLSHTQDSVKIGDGTDFMSVNADGSLNITDNGGSLTVDATDLDIRDLTAASDSVKAQLADGSANYYSATNPVPVYISKNNIGDEVNDYSTASALAAAATSNHDYTVTALKTLLLTQIEASGSGKMKIEVQIETGVATGVFNTRFVQFNSTSEPNMHIELTSPIAVAAGVRVRVIRTNRDNQAQDVYSTICGQEV